MTDGAMNDEATTDTAGRGTGLAGRLGLGGLDYEIPQAANRFTYMLGGHTAFFLVVLILSGLYLDQFYNPNPLGAHDSVLYIIARAPLGDWIRSLHYWSAGAVTVTLVAHLVGASDAPAGRRAHRASGILRKRTTAGAGQGVERRCGQEPPGAGAPLT